MRKIKFRAKQINDNNWISGYGVVISDGFCAIPCCIRGDTCDWKLFTVTCDINTLGQYTGLKDKDGKEIYEGDIIESENYGHARHYVRYIEDDAMFVAMIIDSPIMDYCSINQSWIDKFCKKIIGNIHDNPELIKKEE